MKIAFINTYCNGSTGNIANAISSYCESKGDKTICYYGRVKKESNWIYFGANKLMTILNNVFVFITGRVGGFHKANTKRLVKSLANFSPDVISIHNIHGNYLNFKILFNYLSSFKGKVVFTLHDAFLLSARCCHPNLKCTSFFKCDKCRFLSDYPHVFIDRSKKLMKDKKSYFEHLNNLTLVSPSQYLDLLVNLSYLNYKNHLVIHNGININKYLPKRAQKEKIIKLLFVASPWSPSKGSDIVRELASIVDPSKYQIIVAGNIKKTKLDSIKGISCVGQLNKDSLARFYKECDIFINPTLQDNFPTVLIESLSYGLPVITFDTGGCSEIIDSTCGVLLKEKNAVALSDAIKAFDFSKYTAENCKNRSLVFTEEKMCKEYYELFQK